MPSVNSSQGGRSTGANSLTYALNNVSGTHLLLWIFHIGNTGPATPTAVTYAGVSLTQLATPISDSEGRMDLYRLDAPATGSNNIVITFAGVKGFILAGAVTFTDAGSLGTAQTGTATSGTPSIAVPSASGDLVVDGVSGYDVDSGTWSPGANQTEILEVADSFQPLALSRETATGASTTMTWNQSATDRWFQIGVAVKPAEDPGGRTSKNRRYPLGVGHGIGRGLAA